MTAREHWTIFKVSPSQWNQWRKKKKSGRGNGPVMLGWITSSNQITCKLNSASMILHLQHIYTVDGQRKSQKKRGTLTTAIFFCASLCLRRIQFRPSKATWHANWAHTKLFLTKSILTGSQTWASVGRFFFNFSVGKKRITFDPW